MPDFLLEIGLEEIPARMIDSAEDELRRRVAEVLQRESLTQTSKSADAQTSKSGLSGAPPNLVIEAYSTPRRLAVLARGIAAAQADVEEQVQGPATTVPAIAVQKFAERVGLSVEKLQRVKTAKGEYYAATIKRKGRTAEQILGEALPKEINALYWAKNMYWRAGKPERFVRPVRWMVALLGNEVVPLEYGGVKAGKTSRGHRLLGSSQPHLSKTGLGGPPEHEVEIKEPASYAADLKQAAVIASREERVQIIRKALDAATRQVAGARWREDKELLDTVVNLTEFPAAILGNFEREFLALPEEVLVTVMRDHQKYFAVEDASGKLAPHFVAVLNIDGDPAGIIRHGNERVLRARFRDARFFWGVDQKQPLRERVERLKNVTFQKELGSYYEKAQRMVALAERICDSIENPHPSQNRARVGHPSSVTVDREAVKQAAMLAKTDLTTDLVKEFTELQGIVGGLYARHQKLGEAVALAIYDQYKPASMEEEAPRTVEGAIVSIADKADSIAGMFALGLVPSGSKDPFALRRQANGIVKIIAEYKLPIATDLLFDDAREGYRHSEAEKNFKEGRVADATDYYCLISDFFRERLEFYLKEVKAFAYDVVNAVLAAGFGDIVDAIARAEAVAKVRPSEDFEAISAAFKRIKNIIKQAHDTKKAIAPEFKADAAAEEAERGLASEMQRVAPRVRELAAKREYAAALAEIATIRPAVDTFFDKVMVMVEDEKVRANRLALLHALLNEFSTIADFSEIVTERK